jgi:hypothetical protein
MDEGSASSGSMANGGKGTSKRQNSNGRNLLRLWTRANAS